MTEIIQIKAMSKEEAKKRVQKVLGIAENQILDVKEEIKSSSFLGFFAKEGTYKVTYTNEEITLPEEPKEVIIEKTVEIKEEVVVTEEKVEVTKEIVKEEKVVIDERHKAVDLRKEREQKRANQKQIAKPAPVKEKPKFEERREKPQVKAVPNIEVNEEKLQEILTRAKELIENMGLNLEVSFIGTQGKNYVINLTGNDKGIIIGKKGKTLNSFEYLLNSLIKEARIDVDVEGFKEKRNETLIELANKMSLKAIKTRKVIRLNPMPPRERKIIHEIINQYPELDTYSEGKDPKRYIVIKVKR